MYHDYNLRDNFAHPTVHIFFPFSIFIVNYYIIHRESGHNMYRYKTGQFFRNSNVEINLCDKPNILIGVGAACRNFF